MMNIRFYSSAPSPAPQYDHQSAEQPSLNIGYERVFMGHLYPRVSMLGLLKSHESRRHLQTGLPHRWVYGFPQALNLLDSKNLVNLVFCGP